MKTVIHTYMLMSDTVNGSDSLLQDLTFQDFMETTRLLDLGPTFSNTWLNTEITSQTPIQLPRKRPSKWSLNKTSYAQRGISKHQSMMEILTSSQQGLYKRRKLSTPSLKLPSELTVPGVSGYMGNQVQVKPLMPGHTTVTTSTLNHRTNGGMVTRIRKQLFQMTLTQMSQHTTLRFGQISGNALVRSKEEQPPSTTHISQ